MRNVSPTINIFHDLSRHIVKHRLDWICKRRTGFVKHGFVKHGFVKHEFVKYAFVKGGSSFFVKTRPSVRVHWVACGTCSVPGNFFQVGVCSRYNARSDWLIVTSPRADYGLAKTKQKVINKPYNKLLTNRASSSRTGEYWPWVVFVRTSLRSVRTATTSGQYFPGSTALALG